MSLDDDFAFMWFDDGTVQVMTVADRQVYSSAQAAPLYTLGDPATERGVRVSAVSRTIPELYDVISILLAALDDASSVVDAGDDEEYAYQAELELGRAVLADRPTATQGDEP